MSTDDLDTYNTDSYDPVIADQFRALDGIVAPDTAGFATGPLAASSSGLVELPSQRPYRHYDKHPRDLLPGANVAVRAVAGENGALSLSCEQCSVSVAIEG